jgi:hypothetical protein
LRKSPFGKAVFDCEILTLNKTGFLQSAPERGQSGDCISARSGMEDANYRQRRLLRMRCSRPRRRCGTE